MRRPFGYERSRWPGGGPTGSREPHLGRGLQRPLPPAFDAPGETSLVGTWEDTLGTRQWSHREGPVESLTLAAPLEEMLPETL